MVLSNQVREILLKQSKINSFKNNYKSLIPSNDIPDSKRVYHENNSKTVEKTINLNKKSSKKNKLEVVVTKDDFTFDEIIEIPPEEDDDIEDKENLKNDLEEVNNKTDGIVFFDEVEDEEEGDEDKSKDKKEDNLDKKEDNLDKKEVEEIDLLKMIDKKILADVVNENKDNKSDKKEDIIIENVKKDDKKEDKELKDVKTIRIDTTDTLEQSGGVKKIKLDQKYDFF